jgi:hypothetical protein
MPYRVAKLRRVSIGLDSVFGRLWRETDCGEVINGRLPGRDSLASTSSGQLSHVLHR